jgi:hypothetical protein
MKVKASSLALPVACVLCLGVSAAQAPQAEPSPAPAPLPTLIQALAGNWRLKVHFEPSGSKDKAVDGTGAESWRAGPGNITLIEEERLPRPGGAGFLLGVIWWDGQAKHLSGMECNSELRFTCDLKGALNDITITWDGKKFEIDEIETHGGKRTVWHEAWTDITAHSFLQTGDVTEPDGTMRRFMTVEGTRVQKQEGLPPEAGTPHIR